VHNRERLIAIPAGQIPHQAGTAVFCDDLPRVIHHLLTQLTVVF
jgi:hypothetical protein